MSGITLETVGGTPGTTNETLAVGTFAMGVNIDGMEYNQGPNAVPNVDYAVPTLSELEYYKSQGLDLIRLPLGWETMQTTLGGTLNATYLSEVESVVNNAASLGMRVILDVHNFGGYDGNQIGSAAVTDADFANLWTQLATAFAGNPGIGGYDLMNEPQDMPSATAWTQAAQAAITAIRTVDTKTAIIVEGNDYANSQNWAADNPDLAQLHDPSNNLVFSAHLYLDTDDSGTHYDWAAEAAAGDTTQIGVQRLEPFVAWLQANHLEGEIGELGAGNDNPGWLTALDNTLAYAQANNLPVTYWDAGPWVTNYPYSVEPENGVTAPQMAVLDKYSGDYPTVMTPTVTGTATPGETIYLSENDELLATVTANSAGVFTDTLTGLAYGIHVIVASSNPPTEDGTIAATVFDYVDPPPACFAAGTRISTPEGETAVEDLAVGDRVTTRSGDAPVIWIGKRSINLSRHAAPEKVQPVRIAAGAISDGVPAGDLVLSPDHALCLGGVLIPVKALINGFSIAQMKMSRITYYHLELPNHDILFAERVPAESYLDTGNRSSFEACADTIMLHPDFAQNMRQERGCAPFAEAGREVESVRAAILARAEIVLGDDPQLRVTFRGGDAIIASRTAIPGYLTPDPRDRRVLGVKIGSVRVGDRVISIDHPLLAEGWHDIEPEGRWTNGRAVIPASLLAGCRDVVPEVVATLRYAVIEPARPTTPISTQTRQRARRDFDTETGTRVALAKYPARVAL